MDTSTGVRSEAAGRIAEPTDSSPCFSSEPGKAINLNPTRCHNASAKNLRVFRLRKVATAPAIVAPRNQLASCSPFPGLSISRGCHRSTQRIALVPTSVLHVLSSASCAVDSPIITSPAVPRHYHRVRHDHRHELSRRRRCREALHRSISIGDRPPMYDYQPGMVGSGRRLPRYKARPFRDVFRLDILVNR